MRRYIRCYSAIWLLLSGLVSVRTYAEDKAARHPVPDQAAQKESREVVADVYKQDFAAIRKPGKKAELAKRLLDDGKATENSPEAQYVLLAKARELAAEAGEGATAFAAIGELEKRYDVDGLKLRSDTLQALTKGSLTTPQAQFIVDTARNLMGAAIVRLELDVAESAIEGGAAAARKGKLPKLSKEFAAQAKYVNHLQTESEKLEKAKTALDKDPDNADASHLVGRFACLHQDDWETGLKLLAQGSDEQLAAAAQAELAKPTTPADYVAVGDKWWAALETQNSFDQARMRRRSAHWYRLATDGLSGLDKAKVERRLKSIETAETFGLAEARRTGEAADPTPTEPAAGTPLTISSKQVLKIPEFDEAFAITDIAFSFDGKLVAATDNQNIRVHDTATGKEVANFAGPAARAWSLAFSHDGKFLVAGYEDKTARVWDIPNARLKITIEGSEVAIHSVMFSPDDTLIVTSGSVAGMNVWRNTGKLVGTIPGHFAAFLPNKNRMVVAKSGSAVIYNLANATVEGKIAGVDPDLRKVLVTPDGKTLAVVYIGGRQKIGLFDLTKGTLRMNISTRWTVNSAAFSADGTMLAVTEGTIITIWNTRTGQEIHSVNTTNFAPAVAWSTNGRSLAFGQRGIVEIWDVTAQ